MTGDGHGHGNSDSEVRDWRLWLGIAGSVLWLALGLYYVTVFVGWSRFLEQPSDAIGGFLEGGFAPLAFLWLVIGFFLQQKGMRGSADVIRSQIGELKRTAEQAEVQARAIQANELHARQDTFIEIAAMVHRQLGGIAGLIFTQSQSETLGGAMHNDQIRELWSRAATDSDVFSRQLLSVHWQSGGCAQDVFLGSVQRRRYTDAFIKTFERLLETARGCDPEGIITDAIAGSPHGFIYRVMRQYRDGVPFEEF